MERLYKYDLSIYGAKRLDLQEQAPRILPFEIMELPLPEIIRKITSPVEPGVYLQCKIELEHDHYMYQQLKPYINSFMRITSLPPPTDVMLRMGSCPQRILPHFDSVDNYLLQLVGSKHVLLFDFDVDKVNKVEFMKDVQYLKMEDLKKELDRREITYLEKVVKPNQFVHIKPGKFHYIENVETTGHTASLNLYYEEDEAIAQDWIYAWHMGEKI